MSSDRDSEERLWQVADYVDGEHPAVSDEELRSYRSGQLDAAGRERVEWAIGRDPETRSRMIAIAGGVAGPSEFVRGRLFGGARRRAWWSNWGLVAAAVLVLGIALPLALRWSDTEPPPIDWSSTHFEMQAVGLTNERSSAERLGVVVALPETVLSIRVEPDRALNDRIGYGLYRRDGDGLVRVQAGGAVAIEVGRGAAHIEAPAAALVGTATGQRDYWVLVGERAALPTALAGPVADPSARLLAEVSGAGAVLVGSVRIRGGAE